MKKQKIIVVKRVEWEDVHNPGFNSIEFDGIKKRPLKRLKGVSNNG
jgi:hypothetical protein